jgi:hypothetical protein
MSSRAHFNGLVGYVDINLDLKWCLSFSFVVRHKANNFFVFCNQSESYYLLLFEIEISFLFTTIEARDVP